MAVTAKIVCNLKQTYGDQTTIAFAPDYADGANKQWAQYTPSLDLRMTVKGSVAEQFEPGYKYTLTFEPNDNNT